MLSGVFSVTVIVSMMILLFATMRVANAETHIDGAEISNDAVWVLSDSPYIIDSVVTIRNGASLTIEAGVSVIGSESLKDYSTIENKGNLTLMGKPTKKVTISGSGSITNKGGTTTISNADITIGDGLYLYGGTTYIASSTISSSTYGIYSTQADVNIVDSRISGNIYGIYVRGPSAPVYQVKGDDRSFGIGGIGNALDGLALNDVGEISGPKFTISNSSIVANTEAAVYNGDTVPVHAAMNWWGSEDGPDAIKMRGPVEYTPWLAKDPNEQSEKAVCCSSILFLPGFEGSRLYNSRSMPLGLGTSTTRLWEPLSYGDVRSLYLKDDGSTIDPSIYSDDLLDVALYVKGVYYKLIKYLDGVAKEGTIAGWKPFAYDWRQPIGTIVNDRQKRATTTESLLETVTDLAAHSKTGKVTIVAHSNGGLVAKYLVKTLSESGKADIVDKMISVAVPYLGTPQAIPGLLHGSDQSIALGLVLSEYVSRGLGVNMASAYSLLPSDEYFNKVRNPVITFASTTVTGVNNGSYPLHIADITGQSSFIIDTKNGRVSASTTGTTKADTALAIKGNQSLLDAARKLHDILDPFSWPASIVNWAIIGWNKNTTSGVAYSEIVRCPASMVGLSCTPRPSHEKILTKMGDGTVVAPSAMYDADVVAAVDLESASTEAKIGVGHANIMESSTTLALIDAVIREGGAATGTDTTALRGSLAMMNGVTIGEPRDLAEPTYLVISTHSPVELHVYDSQGNHTGMIPSPLANVPGASEDLYTSFEANIPGSDFSSTDDGDSYVYVPDDGQKYRLEVQGTGVGEFTLDVERKSGADTLQTVEYSVVPTNPLTVASTTVQSGGANGGGGTGGSSQNGNAIVAPLSVDEDGDSRVDATVEPNKPFDPKIYLEMYKKTIATIAGTTPRGKTLSKRIDKLQDLIQAGKMKKAHSLAGRVDKKMSHVKWKKLNAGDKDMILDMFDTFIQQFE